jgi:hypothetical protein
MLNAAVVQRYPIAAGFSSEGSLPTAVVGLAAGATVASFTGAGTLNSTVAQAFSVVAQAAGVGSLSATAKAQFLTIATLSGTGTLSATVRVEYFVAATLSGIGTLKAGAVEQVDGLVASMYSGGS